MEHTLTDDKLDAPTNATPQTQATLPKNPTDTAARDATTKSNNNTGRHNRNHDVSNGANNAQENNTR